MYLLSRLQTKSKDNPSQARHEDFIDAYLERLDARPHDARAERTVSLLARSPQSPAALALISRASALRRHGVVMRAIFTDLGEGGALARFGAALAGTDGGATARDLVRWARNPRLRDAHEQITLGAAMCWSGDCMRREPGKRDSLDLFEREAPNTVRLGALAFEAIWTISEQVPRFRLDGSHAPKPSAAYAAEGAGRLAAFSFLRRAERWNTLAH